MYYYIRSESQLWTVGCDDAKGKWHPDSDHESRENAAKRTAFLNGDGEAEALVAELATLRRQLAEATATIDVVVRIASRGKPRNHGIEIAGGSSRAAT